MLIHRHFDIVEALVQQAVKKVSQESRKQWANFVPDMDGRSTVDIYHRHKEHIAVFEHFNHHYVAKSKLPNLYFEVL